MKINTDKELCGTYTSRYGQDASFLFMTGSAGSAHFLESRHSPKRSSKDVAGGRDTCAGDSGGPVIDNDYLSGTICYLNY